MREFVAIVLALAVPALALAGPTDAEKCQAKKNKIAGKYAACRQIATAKGVQKGVSPDFAKCVEKFDKLWSKAETKWGTSCLTLGDAADIKQRVETCMLGVASRLACVPVGGSCWYLGQDGDSCTDTCANLGLVVDPATSVFAAASAANCNAVLDALGDDNPDVVGPPGACLVGLGCYVSGGTSRSLCISADGAALGGAERACACQ